MNQKEMKEMLERMRNNDYDMSFEFELDENNPCWISVAMWDKDMTDYNSTPGECSAPAMGDLSFYGRIRYLGQLGLHHLVEIEEIDENECILSRRVTEASCDAVFALLYMV